MSKYTTVGDGSKIEVAPNTKFIWQLACCDCGLVHNILVEVDATGTVFTIHRNSRATGQRRRYMKKWQIATTILENALDKVSRHKGIMPISGVVVRRR